MNKELVYLIEDLPFTPLDIWYTFLVALGKKRSAWIGVSSDIWREGQEPKHIDNSRIEAIKKTFETVGLKYRMNILVSSAGIRGADEGGERLREVCDIFISLDDETLDKLVIVAADFDHQATGELLGFPKTAVDAFKSRDLIEKIELAPSVRFSEVVSFTQFRLSKENWKQELDVVQDWLETLKSISNITYLECRRYLHVLDDKTREILVDYYK